MKMNAAILGIAGLVSAPFWVGIIIGFHYHNSLLGIIAAVMGYVLVGAGIAIADEGKTR